MTMDELCGMTAKVAVGANARFLARLQGVRTGLSQPDTLALSRRVSGALGRRDAPAVDGLIPRVSPAIAMRGRNPATEDSLIRNLERAKTRPKPTAPDPTDPFDDFAMPGLDDDLAIARDLGGFYTADKTRKLREMAGNAADSLATSGRHGPVRTLPGWAPPTAGEAESAGAALFRPGVVYKGGVPGAHPASRLQLSTATPGAPAWVSGYPFVSAGYARTAAGTQQGYVASFPTSSLAAAGPHSPTFTPHIGRDSRVLSPGAWAGSQPRLSLAENKLRETAPAAGGNTEWGALPNYEAVITTPKKPLADLAAGVYKTLPSGRGFQAVANKPLPSATPPLLPPKPGAAG